MKREDCHYCRGSGSVKCLHCGGIGAFHLPAKTLGEWQTLPIPQPCRQCEGDGEIDCPECLGKGTKNAEDGVKMIHDAIQGGWLVE